MIDNGGVVTVFHTMISFRVNDVTPLFYKQMLLELLLLICV